jgi:hypothetical protein
MKKIISAVLALACIFTNIAPVGAEYSIRERGETTGKADQSDWFEWNLPDDSAAFGTAIDASFLLDAPAGKHGFLKTKDDDFCFEDGTIAHFWGVNFGTALELSSYEEIDKIVDRCARLGFNLIRFHAMGANSRHNIFGETSMTSATKVDTDQLDRLFYCISKFKERGIYIYLDIMVKRNYIPDEILPNLGSSSNWSGQWWDKDLIRAKQTVWEQILCVENPYTGIKLADDPVIACFSIANESTVIGGYSNYTDYFGQEYTSKFNAWLKEKYKTREALKEAWDYNTDEWLNADRARWDRTMGLQDGEDFDRGTVIPYTDTVAREKCTLGRWTDMLEFTYDLQAEHDKLWKDWLRNDIGFKGCITFCDMGMNYNQSLLRVHEQMNTEADFLAGHQYKAHPLDFAWKTGSGLTGRTSTTMFLGTEIWRCPPWLNLYHKPFILSEWSSVPPGIYAAEGTLTNAVVMAYQNMNSIHFAYGEYFKTQSVQDSFFANDGLADMTSIFPVTAMVYLRGDIQRAEKEYYLKFKKEETYNNNAQGIPLGFQDIWMYADTGVYFTDDNREDLDYAAEPEVIEEAMRKRENNELPSEQLQWSKTQGIFKVETEYTNLTAGFTGEKELDFEFSTIKPDTYGSCVVLTSATKDTLEDSNKILLTTITRSQNKGFSMDDTGYVVDSPGSTPQMLEPVKAEITIKTDKDIKVYALDESGQHKAEVKVEKLENGYSRFVADGKEYKAVHYEISK